MKDRSHEDLISEEEYTRRMTTASSLPENDSPGDSEDDAGAEFLMGLEYEPDPSQDPEMPPEEALSADLFDEDEFTKLKEAKHHPMIRLPPNAEVINSEEPSPWMDMESATSTH